MFLFSLIGLLLILIGVVGLQFTYLFYIGRIFHERKKYLQALEHKAEKLTRDLEAAHALLAEQKELLDACPELKKKDEIWAEVIDER